MDEGAVFTGVCLAAAFGSILMGILANYPVALAPGMGENFFFVSVVAGCAAAGVAPPGEAWRVALGVVLVSGVIFLALSFLNIRKALMESISPSMKYAIASGIGLFIALIGLRNGGVISTEPHSMHYELNPAEFASRDGAIFFVGLVVMAALRTLKVRGAVLFGIVASTVLAMFLGEIKFTGVFSAPPSPMPVLGKADVAAVFKNIVKLLPFIVVFTFMDVFDTLGTLLGVGAHAGLLDKEGNIPNAKRAFAADSVATVAGGFMGQSTVTSYIESATGVEYGGRTGLTAVATGFLFLLALFISPLAGMVGNCAPAVAPALVVVGALMMENVGKIDWGEPSEAIPSFLVLAGIPFCFSIADGLTLGFVAYPVVKLLGGKGKEIGWLTYLIAAVLALYLLGVKTGALEKALG
jgi:AGZA family xanthine/uracil permease-like MFS transporter